MASDRSWMHRRFDARNNITEEYKIGVQNFINVALKGDDVDSKGKIRCPCKECGNTWYKLPENVTYDLYRHGIMESYSTWIFHGEKRRSRVEAETSSDNIGSRNDDMEPVPVAIRLCAVLAGSVTTVFNCQGPLDAPTFVGSGLVSRKMSSAVSDIHASAAYVTMMKNKEAGAVAAVDRVPFSCPEFVKTNRLLAGVILTSCFVTFAEAREIAATKELFKSCWLLVLFLILMAVGASGSGSARSRVTGNRGEDERHRRRARGRGRGGSQTGSGRDVGRGNGEDEDAEYNGEEGCDEEHRDEDDDDDEGQSEVDAIRFGRAERSICDGDYKKKPKNGEPKLGVVTFINKKNIKQARYKRTLKAIVRNNWEFDTAKEKGRAREAFLNTCIEEFKEYYDYPREHRDDIVKVLEGDAVVRKHLKTNLKYYMNGWKSAADKRVAKAHANGIMSANRRTCAPYYLSESAWDGLNEYWESETFSKMSEIGRENIMASEIKHCSGAKPFDQRYEASSFYSYDGEMEEKSQKRLTVLEKFDASYKKKGLVEEMGRKLKDAVERATHEDNSQDTPPSLASQRKREVELLLEVCPPKKNKVIMFPRHTLPELIGMDEAAKWTTSQSTPACIPERVSESAYSIIGKVLTEVTNMVEALEEIEVTRTRLDEEVHNLATRAYPNRDDPASKILWEEYIRLAAQMISPLFERYKKVILQDTRTIQMDWHEDNNDVHLEELETRYPL
ncbi:hypothetical protein POM88_020688 [Heracleum sosnowskyi]|uniref:Transposase-associated domain-containing protein n=1 Tax=Heracleum sosnowskyi TaxID=360622 RepID=A0AAD8MT40_9APIA|nr:hypothetical protein POM88_020688 [Heracleum sosnowskyi]